MACFTFFRARVWSCHDKNGGNRIERLMELGREADCGPAAAREAEVDELEMSAPAHVCIRNMDQRHKNIERNILLTYEQLAQGHAALG